MKIELPRLVKWIGQGTPGTGETSGWRAETPEAVLDRSVAVGWLRPYADGYLMTSARGDVGLSRVDALRWASRAGPALNRAIFNGVLSQNEDGSFNVQRGARGRMLQVAEAARMVMRGR